MKKTVLLFLILLTFISCTTIAKMVTGIRNPQAYTSNEERVKYYAPFIEKGKGFTEIRHFVNQDTLIAGFNGLKNQDLPFMILFDAKTNIYYDINCYEDVNEDIISVNNNDFTDLIKATNERVELAKIYMRQTQTDTRITPDYSPIKNGRFEVYHIGGIFLGNKLKRRVLPIYNLNKLKSVQLVEISMEEEVK